MIAHKIWQALNDRYYIYKILGDRYRARAYKNATTAMAVFREEVLKDPYKFVGKKLGDKIAYAAKTGDLSQFAVPSKMHKLIELSKIKGVGPVQLRKWIDKGINSVQDLNAAIKAGEVELTKLQKIGLLYHKQLNSYKLLEEAKALYEDFVYTFITKLSQHMKRVNITTKLPLNKNSIYIIPAGSIRRNSPTVNDIDILISSHLDITPAINKVIDEIAETANLLLMSRGKERYAFLWKKKIQIDILVIAPEEIATALFYFTGSAYYNERVRAIAKTKGYTLNQHGLFKDGERIDTPTERDITRILEIPYTAPKLR